MTERTISRKVYVADDGKEFNTYGECFCHEEDLWAEEAKKTMNIVKLDIPSFLGREEETYWIAKITSEEEKERVNEFIKKHYDKVDDFTLKPETSLYVINITDCGDVWCWAMSKEDIGTIGKMYSQFMEVVLKGESVL